MRTMEEIDKKYLEDESNLIGDLIASAAYFSFDENKFEREIRMALENSPLGTKTDPAIVKKKIKAGAKKQAKLIEEQAVEIYMEDRKARRLALKNMKKGD